MIVLKTLFVQSTFLSSSEFVIKVGSAGDGAADVVVLANGDGEAFFVSFKISLEIVQ